MRGAGIGFVIASDGRGDVSIDVLSRFRSAARGRVEAAPASFLFHAAGGEVLRSLLRGKRRQSSGCYSHATTRNWRQ